MRNSLIRFGLSTVLVAVVIYLGWPRSSPSSIAWNPATGGATVPSGPGFVELLPSASGDAKRGLDAMARADKDPKALEEALTALETAAKADPKDSAAAFGLGWALQVKQDYAGAEREYRRALPLAADKKAVDVQYYVGHNLGGLLVAQKRYDDASQMLWLAAGLRHQWYDLFNLGLCFMQLGKMKDAQFAFNEALRTRPDDANIHFQLGLVQLRMGKADRAQVEFSEAARLDPSMRASIASALSARK